MQNSGPWDLWLPVVENSRLYAQRGHSARCAPVVTSLTFSNLATSNCELYVVLSCWVSYYCCNFNS